MDNLTISISDVLTFCKSYIIPIAIVASWALLCWLRKENKIGKTAFDYLMCYPINSLFMLLTIMLFKYYWKTKWDAEDINAISALVAVSFIGSPLFMIFSGSLLFVATCFAAISAIANYITGILHVV